MKPELVSLTSFWPKSILADTPILAKRDAFCGVNFLEKPKANRKKKIFGWIKSQIHSGHQTVFSALGK